MVGKRKLDAGQGKNLKIIRRGLHLGPEIRYSIPTSSALAGPTSPFCPVTEQGGRPNHALQVRTNYG